MTPSLVLMLALATTLAGAGADVADAVHARLQALSEGLPGELELQVLGNPAAPALPAGNVEVIVGAPAGRWPRARVAVPVEYQMDGRVLRRQTVWVAVRWWREVDAYAKSAPVGESVGKVRTERRRLDLAPVAGTPAPPPAGDAFRLARPVRAGQPVLAGDFEPLPDVVTGARLRVEAENGAVRVSTTGRALADGAVGEVIPVSVDGASAPVLSRIVTPEVARVEE